MSKKILLTLCLLINTCFAIEIPKLNTFVTDQANVISQVTKTEITNQLKQLKQNTGIEIGVFTIDTLEGYPLDQFGIELGRKNSIGLKDKDTGALYILAIDDKKTRIEVGYGLEGSLTDAATFNIQQDVKPLLKSSNYDQAISEVINNMIAATKGEYIAPPTKTSNSSDNIIGFIIYFVIFLLSVIGRILGKTKSIWLGGILGGVSFLLVSIYLAGTFVFIIGMTIFGSLLGLLFDYLYSHGKLGNSSGGGFFGGGGSFGSGGGGGSFGGGGGGSFGGGGSSSSW